MNAKDSDLSIIEIPRGFQISAIKNGALLTRRYVGGFTRDEAIGQYRYEWRYA